MKRKDEAMTEVRPRVFLLCGSGEKRSYVRTSLDLFASKLTDYGALPVLWDLAEQPLPLFSPSLFAALSDDAMLQVREFLQQVELADAFVLGTPVYHNSFSGILKNALDMLSARALLYKPVALVSNGYNDRTACQPCEHLRSVVRGLAGIAIPTQVVLVPTDFLLVEGRSMLTSPSLLERFAQIVQELLYFTTVLRSGIEVPV
jgi:azobenzene reductase